jgi:galactose oxidase-like protein/List-Bact-rpt repeat protein
MSTRRLGRYRVMAGVLLCAAAFLTGCQGGPDATSPEFAQVKLPRVLTVTGGGTGGGTVTAPFYGETGALNCVITNGVAPHETCSRAYGWKTQVLLTVKPDPGSTFTGWSGACNGTGTTCRLTMTQSRSVKASFGGQGTPSFTLNISGSGTGSGTVSSQVGLTPAISCSITSGSAASAGCSATYLQGTSVTLTTAPAAGHTFESWSGDCAGTAACSLTMNANHAAAAILSAPPGIEASVGKWDAPQTTTFIGLHLIHLFGGKYLEWGYGEPQLWDAGGGGFTQKTFTTCTDPANCKLFCSGHTFLADGRLLVAGGEDANLGSLNGLKQASTFDGSTWSATGSMTYARWYPTLVTLPDGSVVAIAGSQAPGTDAPYPERYVSGTWRVLTGASYALGLALYPRAFVEPKNGNVFVANEVNPSLYLNPAGTGSWSDGPFRVGGDRNYGAAVMLDTKVLYVGGGGQNNCPGSLPKASAEIIDLAAATPTWTSTGSLSIGRRHLNATILPDGKVLASGGSSQCGFSNEAGSVYAAEMWDPADPGHWTPMANASVLRVYHSTTALLPDGRVLSTGSGDGGGGSQQTSYEIYSPPYLFLGPRPTYNLAGSSVHYGVPFTVTTPNASSITKVTIIRHAASTHAFDMGQRLNTLPFQVAADGLSLTVTPPAAGKLAPPGPYMLFILNNRGVPSVAQTVLLGP